MQSADCPDDPMPIGQPDRYHKSGLVDVKSTGPLVTEPAPKPRGWAAPNGAYYRVSPKGWDNRPVVIRTVPGKPPRLFLGFADGSPFPSVQVAIGWCIADGKLADPDGSKDWAEREEVTACS
jgi:hypothetical protein